MEESARTDAVSSLTSSHQKDSILVTTMLRRTLALLLLFVMSRAALAQKPDEARTPATAPSPAKISGTTPVVGRNLTYVVKPGEDLYTLGLRHHLAIEHLMWANGLSSEQVKPGTKIIIPLQHVLPATLQEGLVINLPERGVYLFKDGECIAFYPCAIGMGGRFATPTGDTRIVNKQVDPTWDPPEWANLKEPIGPGPNNPLGDRWIGLGIDGVGLHGTTQPMSIGQNASHGCMRMYPHVVRILFDQVKVGMPVRIVYETVKVGVSDDHKLFVQTYPDVYGQVADRTALLREKIARAGLSDFVDEAALKRLAADKSGLPQRVLGDDIVIKVNNQRIATSVAPFLREGQIWTSSEVLRAMGARLHYQEKTLMVTMNGKTVRFETESRTDPKKAESHETPHTAASPSFLSTAQASPSPGETSETPDASPSTDAGASRTIETLEFVPRRFNGKALVPVKPLLQTFGLTFKWLPKHKTLLIYSPYQDAGT